LPTLGFIPLICYRIRIEEKMLLEKFGDEYREYMKKTNGQRAQGLTAQGLSAQGLTAQGMVEFALVLPLMLLVMFLMTEMKYRY
jgi:hypothetical protein